MMKSISTFFKENTLQKWFLIGYCAFISVLFILRILRNNQEFLFFSGVIAALYYFYNNAIFSYNILKYVYLTIDLILFFVFVAIGKETISMLFPIITFIFLFIGRFVFIKAFRREPKMDILLEKNTDKIYTLIMFFCIIISWVAIVVKFMDHHIV